MDLEELFSSLVNNNTTISLPKDKPSPKSASSLFYSKLEPFLTASSPNLTTQITLTLALCLSAIPKSHSKTVKVITTRVLMNS